MRDLLIVALVVAGGYIWLDGFTNFKHSVDSVGYQVRYLLENTPASR